MININLLLGGNSNEHYVAISCALSLIKRINYYKYNIYIYYIDYNNLWYANAIIKNIFLIKKYTFLCYSYNKHHASDLIVPITYGYYGEKGLVQCVLEHYKDIHIGSKSFILNKFKNKLLIKNIGCNIIHCVNIKKSYYKKMQKALLKKIIFKISNLLFIKSATSGSSLGLINISCYCYINKYIINVLSSYHSIMIEENIINSVEIEISIMQYVFNNETILIHTGYGIFTSKKNIFYNYKNKYFNINNNSLFYYKKKYGIDRLFNSIFVATKCTDLLRVNFFIKRQSLLYNESNIYPGISIKSLYIILLSIFDLTYNEILDVLINKSINFYI